jgi:hypothetical protein
MKYWSHYASFLCLFIVCFWDLFCNVFHRMDPALSMISTYTMFLLVPKVYRFVRSWWLCPNRCWTRSWFWKRFELTKDEWNIILKFLDVDYRQKSGDYGSMTVFHVMTGQPIPLNEPMRITPNMGLHLRGTYDAARKACWDWVNTLNNTEGFCLRNALKRLAKMGILFDDGNNSLLCCHKWVDAMLDPEYYES